MAKAKKKATRKAVAVEVDVAPAKVGRPSKYQEHYCDLIVDHMAEGYSYESFAAIARVNIDSLYEWEKVHPAFSEAKKVGVALGQHYWETRGMKGMNGEIVGFNSTVWIFTMKNRFKWHDNVKVQHEADPKDKAKDTQIEKLSAHLAALKGFAEKM